MKRKRYVIGAAAVLTAACVITLTGISVHADTRVIKSRGNFVLDSGNMSIHAADVDYLQSEVAALYGELPSILEISGSGAGTARRDKLDSKGIMDYKNGAAILDSSDFTLIADELDNLESEYKANAVAALNDMNTYFKIDGTVTHDQRESNLSAAYANNLSLDGISNGIEKSQSVDHLAADPIIEDNLTAGTAAWVNGKCIIGNGADNERAYKKGEEDGEEGDGEDIDIDYTYHIHVNGLGEEVTEEIVYALDDPGGCYVPDGHKHNVLTQCDSKYHAEERCGHAQDFWDSDAKKYRCPYHGGDYQAEMGGTCSYVTSPAYIEWKCGSPVNTWKIGCGKDNNDIESVVITIRKKVKE